MTGSPAISRRMPTKSSRCIGRIFASARARCSRSPPGSFRAPPRFAPGSKNMCSVRHSPIPSAPNSRAIFASCGVSALARTPSVRSASAHDRNFLKNDDISGSTVGTRPSITSPADAVERDVFAAMNHRAVGRLSVPARVVDFERRASRHAALAHPARDHRRVTGHPAARGQDSLRHLHPVDVLGRGLDPHQDYLAPGLGDRDRFVGREHHFAEDRARRRRQPARDHVLFGARGSSRGCSNCSSCTGSTRISAVARSISFSSAMSTAIRTAASRRALAVAGLQHEEPVALDREFHVLHVAEMLFEPRRDFQQLVCRPSGKLSSSVGRLRRALVLADARRARPIRARPAG